MRMLGTDLRSSREQQALLAAQPSPQPSFISRLRNLHCAFLTLSQSVPLMDSEAESKETGGFSSAWTAPGGQVGQTACSATDASWVI